MSASKSDGKMNHQTQNAAKPNEKEQPIPINGFKQVLDMLRIADPEFRESILRRLAHRDRELAESLRRDLNNL